jgi:nucleoside-diphosphate-sugar epimerase
VTEESPLEPHPDSRGHYTRGKLLAERHVLGAVRKQNLPAVIVRPGILVGPEGPGLDALNAVVVRSHLVLLGDASIAPPLIDLKSAADLILRAGCAPALEPGTILHAIGSQSTAARALATRLARDHGLRLHRIPGLVMRVGAGVVAALARAVGRAAPITPYRMRAADARLRFDCTRARTELGWTHCADGPPEAGQAAGSLKGPASGAPAAVA